VHFRLIVQASHALRTFEYDVFVRR
jgi:hypothetical protein